METRPYLNVTAPGFSTKAPEVLAARAESWCAQTPLGLAVLRHREAGLLLRDRRLRQGSHAWPEAMGLEGSFARFWKDSIISREGPEHKELRRIAMSALSTDWIKSLAPRFEAVASELAEGMPEHCDFIRDFSEPFAGRAITTLLGLPDKDAEQVAHDASRLGLAMGLDAKEHEPVFNAATDRLCDLARDVLGRGADDETFVGRLVRAGDSLSEQALADLVVIAIFGGVDTTRAQLGFAMALFADHQDQWAMVCRDPSLIPNAIEEVIRAWPTTTWSTREAIVDFSFQGVDIRRGTTIHIWVHSSATDPDRCPGWRFDITADRPIHFGFGGGAHHCLGQFVARTDMAAALRVLAGRFSSVEFAGAPEWLPDSGNTSPAKLPLLLK